MNTVFAMILTIYGGNNYQQFVETPSPKACAVMLSSFKRTPMKIVTEAHKANGWGDVKYGCISKQNMMEMSGATKKPQPQNDDDMNDVNETE